MYRFIKVNKAKCLECSDILISPPDKADKLITCRCGNLTISGGSTHKYRKGKNYQEMCVLNFENEAPSTVKTDTPIPPPNSSITAKELEERKRKLKQ
jgi:hypothetical protein